MTSSAALVHLPGDLTVAVREMHDSDRPYILSSWARHVSHWLEYQQGGATPVMATINRRCEKLLGRYGAIVAVNPEIDGQMLGWACLDKARSLAHFVFVLAPFRKAGIAKLLCASLRPPILASHWSADAEWLQSHVTLRYVPSQAR